MTEEQATQLLDKVDVIIQHTADILAMNQHQALYMMFLCGLVVAGFLCVIFFGGLK